MQSVNDIRSGFLDFFRRNGHEIRPSGSLVPHNDPTLMFANAGMNQFKNVFTGMEKPPTPPRVATVQKCVRAGGKHNDLDNVGYTARHHTFFEMLGNFSFGDYFKEGAIELAWELLTKNFCLPLEKLCVTVSDSDDIAWNYWKKLTGFPDHKIIRLPGDENFWSMGDTGPCGFISEIFYDHGEHIKGGPPGSPNADGDRFVEIWNLVFMQYEQLADGRRIDLPKPSIDTGMGLERISAVLQGVHDNYDIDLFKRLIATIKDQATQIGGQPAKETAAYKVIADHLRSSCFLIADGVMPSNEGRGYVLRRIMRRAMRYAHQLGCREPLMYRLVPSLVTEMGNAYPELKRAEATITENLKVEEEQFKRTLERGLKLLEEEVKEISPDSAQSPLPRSGGGLGRGHVLSGNIAFKLYDTYGFPLDLTQDILRARGIGVDTEGFEKSMAEQRERAREAWSGSGEKATGKIWFELKEKIGKTEFLGYEKDKSEAKVVALVKHGQIAESATGGETVSIILDRTPFYGESGGQVGDHGLIYENGKVAAQVVDTQKPLEDFYVQNAVIEPNQTLKIGDSIIAEIDVSRRNAIRANHSATHLLHKALRDQLGEHVTQKGSLVDAQRLRFDFSHPKAVNKEELKKIEDEVNMIISRGGAVSTQEMAPDDAIKAGAMALFGEKYGDKVRVLSMGKDESKAYSVELCGGTHVRKLEDIDLFKITSEGSVASGIRRIEAVTGAAVYDYLNNELTKQFGQLHALEVNRAQQMIELEKLLNLKHAELVFTPQPETIKKSLRDDANSVFDNEFVRQEKLISSLQDEIKKLSRQLSENKKQQALSSSGEVKPEKIGSVNFIGKSFEGLDPKELRPVAENYLKQADVVAVASQVEGKASIVIAVNKGLTEKHSAVTLVQAAVAELGGKGGGGRPDMAQGGGPNASKLTAALEKIKSALQN